VVGLGGVGSHDDKDANDEAEHEGIGEPEVVGKGFGRGAVSCRNGGAHEGDEPRKLFRDERSVEGARKGRTDGTYDGDGERSQRERVPKDIVHVHGAHASSPATVIHMPVHFAERWRVQ